MAHEFSESLRVCPSFDGHQLELYKTFLDALYSWNQRKNLTRVPIEQCDIRHFAESLLVAEFASGSVLDLGTGPGFPAWPLACALPKVEVVAIDSNGKMLDFLRSMPLPNLQVVQGRIEEQKWEEKFGLVTGRAFAPLLIQLECSVRPCRTGGLIVPFRSAKDDLDPKELESLGLELTTVKRSHLSDGVERILPVYKKVTAPPPDVPRPWAVMKRAI